MGTDLTIVVQSKLRLPHSHQISFSNSYIEMRKGPSVSIYVPDHALLSPLLFHELIRVLNWLVDTILKLLNKVKKEK